MARATRSTAQHHEKEKEKHPDNTPATLRNKPASKKRKRGSILDNGDQPAVKQLRTDATVKAEDSLEPESFADTKIPQLQNAGDVPIDPTDAQKILDILEMYVPINARRQCCAAV
jgi:hypothetical protein